jgi:hypothetical protein
MALHHLQSEKEHLLASRFPAPRPSTRFISPSITHSDKQHRQPTAHCSSSTFSTLFAKTDQSSPALSLPVQLIIAAMVAIPTYMMASTAVTSLGPLWPRNEVIRSPKPDPLPQTTSSAAVTSSDSGASTDNAFASVGGPHISTNFPDPAVIHVNGMSYAFATNNRVQGAGHINIQVATSSDNQTWTIMDGHDALPTLGAWETGAGTWAPDVVQLVSLADLGCLNDRHH